ncbi:MAG: glycosyltransferase [Ignavibacteria bacterium]
MKKLNKNLLLILLVITCFVMTVNTEIYSQMTHNSGESSISQADFKMAMRKLWEDHIVWTRNVIFNIIDGLEGTDKAVERLLKNQDDIGNAIKPFYGEEAGKKLTELLSGHITTAADLLKAAKVNDQNAFTDANKKWYDNADEIAAFLSGANPNWPKKDMTQMMHEHLALTTEEAVARLKKDFAADVAAYDKVHDEILMMSDALADGIIKQFPEKFNR